MFGLGQNLILEKPLPTDSFKKTTKNVSANKCNWLIVIAVWSQCNFQGFE